MKMGRNYKEQRVIERIYRNEQGHLLRFWKDLDDGERDLLIKDMRGIDFEVLKKAKTLLLKKEALKKVIEQPAVIRIPDSSRQTEEEKEAREKGRMETVLGALKVEKRFINEHLSKWVPEFCNRVIIKSQFPFYSQISELTKDFVLFEKECMDAYISEAESKEAFANS